MFLAVGAQPLQHIAHFSNGIVVGHIYHRNLHLVEADDAPALLAVEVGVPVIVEMGIVTVAQFVAHALATLYQMHQMMFPEQCKGARDDRFVNAHELSFEFSLRQRPLRK